MGLCTEAGDNGGAKCNAVPLQSNRALSQPPLPEEEVSVSSAVLFSPRNLSF